MNIEILKRMRLLMEYNTALTHDENLELIESYELDILDEQADEILTRIAGGAARNELDDVIRSMAKGKVPLQSVDGVVIRTIDDLDNVIAAAEKSGVQPFTSQMLGTFRKNLMKSPNIPLGSKSAAIDDLINGKSFQQKYGAVTDKKTIVDAMKTKNGFTDDVANEIADRHLSRGPKPPSAPPAPPKPPAPPAPPAPPVGPSSKSIIQKIGDKWATMSRTQKIVALAAGGIGAYYLWQWIKGEDPKLFPNCLLGHMTDEDTKRMAETNFGEGIIITTTGIKQLDIMGGLKFFPNGECESMSGISGEWSSDESQISVSIGGQTTIIPCKGIKPPPDPDKDRTEGGGGGGGSSSGTKWRTDCAPNYVRGCKADKIAEVQGCLGGLKVDGKWGPKTQAALDKVGFGGGFTDSDVDKICNKTSTTTQPKPIVSPIETEIDTGTNDY